MSRYAVFQEIQKKRKESMQKGNREQEKFRKQVADILMNYGYECYVPGQRSMQVNRPFEYTETPRIDEISMENDLKKLNKGEAFYYCENTISDASTLYWGIKEDTQDYRDTLAYRQDVFYNWLTCGQEFCYPAQDGNNAYGLVKFIDYNQPQKNSFRALTQWKGCQENGFLWDFVITVNSMPLVAVVIEPDEQDLEPCEHAYLTLQQELEADQALSTYVQFCFISNGTQTLVGTTTDVFCDFKTWYSFLDQEHMGEPVALLPFLSLLRPDRLLELVSDFNRLTEYSQYSDMKHWSDIMAQMAQLAQQMAQIPPESAHFELAQKTHAVLCQLISAGFAESSPLKNTLLSEVSEVPEENSIKTVPAEKDDLLKTPLYVPKKKDYIKDAAEHQRFCTALLNLLNKCSVPNDNYMYACGMRMEPSKFMACLYSACVEHLDYEQRANLKAFYNLFDEVRNQMEETRRLTLKYDAISKKTMDWRELADAHDVYAKLFLHEISLEKLPSDTESRKRLKVWKDLYAAVVEEGRKVGLFKPAQAPEI